MCGAAAGPKRNDVSLAVNGKLVEWLLALTLLAQKLPLEAALAPELTLSRFALPPISAAAPLRNTSVRSSSRSAAKKSSHVSPPAVRGTSGAGARPKLCDRSNDESGRCEIGAGILAVCKVGGFIIESVCLPTRVGLKVVAMLLGLSSRLERD